MHDAERNAFEARFDTYVGELREVFARGGLRFGRPKDLVAVAQALSGHGTVREGAEAVIRSIVLRERAGLSRAEVTSIVVVAAGGEDLYGSAQEGSALQQLDAFVNAMWLSSRTDVADEGEKAAPQDREPSTVATGGLDSKAIPIQETMPVAELDADSSKAGVQRGGARRPQRAGLVAGVCLAAMLLAAGLVWQHRMGKPEGKATQGTKAAPQAILPSSGGVQSSTGPEGDVPTGGLGLTAPQKSASATDTSRTANDGRPGDSPSALAGVARGPGGGTPHSASAGPQPPLPEKDVLPSPRPKRAVAVTATPAPVVAVPPQIGGKYVVSSGVMGGHLIAASQPGYPKMAKMWGIEGQVILQAVVSRKGQVVATHVLDGHTMLRGSATNAVKKFRYRPYVVDGKATDIATVVIVNYKLKP